MEAVIDVAHRVLSLHDQPPASTAGKALDALQSLGAIQDASSYKRMVQFRNLVVHRYETVDNAVLVEILERYLDDFARFLQEIQSFEDRAD